VLSGVIERLSSGTTNGQHGTVLVMVALWMPVVVLMLSFVINAAHWFEHRRHLQLQADAAAYAGGDMFGACFTSFGTGSGNDAIFSEATKYAGNVATFNGSTLPYAPLYNFQIGGPNKGPISVLYQSPRFASDDPAAVTDPSAETQPPCSTPSLMFDVKATESNLPWFLGGGLVSAINAHARVQLRALASATPSLPLAVPDINPRQVGVTFVNEATGGELSGCSGSNVVTGTTCTFTLAKGTPAGGLNIWSGPASITLPAAPAKIGVRIGLGGSVSSCANTNGTSAYTCFDGASTIAGLTMIRDHAIGSAPGPPPTQPPVLDGVWLTSCSGNGAFFFLLTGTCTAGVTAKVHYGTGTTAPPSTYHVRASVAGGPAQDLSLVAYDATSGVSTWSTPPATPLSLASQAGVLPVTLSWEVNDTSVTIGGEGCKTGGGNKCMGDFPGAPHQRFYSGTDDFAASGPIRSLQITGGSDPNGPASLVAPGPHTLTVTVGVAGSYGVHTPCAPPPSGGAYTCFSSDRAVLLRLKQDRGPNTFTVDCSGGTMNIRTMIEQGCTKAFSISSSGACPNPTPPDPPDCVPVQTGAATGQIRQGMNTRFSTTSGACLPNNYPTVAPGDQRVVLAMITDFSAFSGSGGGSLSVPVTTFGAFYVTGWDGASGSCDNEPRLNTGFGATSSTGDVWGHFIRYVATGGTGGTGICDPSGLTPCVPVLTR
jgi:hypothetical protein